MNSSYRDESTLRESISDHENYFFDKKKASKLLEPGSIFAHKEVKRGFMLTDDYVADKPNT